MGQDYRELYQDAERRPDHYGELLHYLDKLKRGEDLNNGQRSALLVRYTEPTQRSPASKLLNQVTAPKMKVPVFEDQDADPGIKII